MHEKKNTKNSLHTWRVLTMIICPGEGCGVRAKSDRALTTHLKTCDKAKARLALVGTEVE